MVVSLVLAVSSMRDFSNEHNEHGYYSERMARMATYC